MRLHKAMGWMLGALATACTMQDAREDELSEQGDGGDALEFRDGPPAIYDQAAPTVCPAWRQVVETDDPTCRHIGPLGRRWTGQRLFPGWEEHGYDRYCVYEFESPAPLPGDLHGLRTAPGVVKMGADCSVAGSSSSLPELIEPELLALSKKQIDTLSATELGLPDSETDRARVLVAVLDTIPTVIPQDPRDDHGLVVAEAIERIAHGCAVGDPACKVLVKNYLALPRFGPGAGNKGGTRGGHGGLWSEVAAATYNAVRDWEQLSGPRPKLILNYSIGWLDAFHGDTPPPAVDAMLLALRRASCRGALILAAAGNDMQDCTTGPMAPGIWEKFAAPTVDECEDLGIFGAQAQAEPQEEPTYAPLVHSVGGLDHRDRKVSVSRAGGRPRMAALADHVTLDPDFAPRTGTSMSTAAVSGIAALVWSYRPDLLPADLAQLIWGSGIDVGRQADYGLDGVLDNIHRATACRAMVEACSGGACSGVALPTCREGVASLQPLDEAMSLVVADETPQIGEGALVGTCDGYCGSEVTTYDVTPEALCEELPGDARVDYLFKKQPPHHGCSSCLWKTSGSVQASGGSTYQVFVDAALTGSYATWTDSGVTVTLKFVDETIASYRLGDVNLSSATKTLEILPSPTVEVKSATISITFGTGSTATTITGDLLPPTGL